MSAKTGQGQGQGQGKTAGANTSGIELFSPTYYAASALGGAVACGPTHMGVTPLDLVKCNVQSNPELFKSTPAGLRAIYSGAPESIELGLAPGLRGVIKGWGPTFVGYSIQGAGKYGGYEFFKHEFAERLSPESRTKYKDLVNAAASASAEFFADIGLCPFEAVKVRIQTNPKFASGLMDGLPKMLADGGIGGLYAGLGPLWARQIPYTVAKFVSFERIADLYYQQVEKRTGRKKEDMSPFEALSVVFAAGYTAGIVCAVVSHPADTMVSKINAIKMEGSLLQKVSAIYSGTEEKRGIGFKGLWGGLGTRIVMIGTLTGAQWLFYGAFKNALGLPTPGGGH